MRRVRAAVIGAGRLGGFHAQKLAANKQVDLVGVVDPDVALAQNVAKGCETESFGQHAPLFGHVDAAVIAAPTRLHHQLALDFLHRGVHLLVEKPLCATSSEAAELVQVARQNNVVLQTGHVERFNPAFGAATTHVENPKYIESTRAGAFTFRSTDVGVVMDLMIHDIDLILSMVRSKVRKVDALGFSVLGGHEDVANARLEFESGCIATLNASRISSTATRIMNLWGGRAFAGIDFGSRTANIVRPSEVLLRRQFDVDALSADEVEYYKTHLAVEHLPCETLEFDAVDALALEVNDFVESILIGRVPRVSGEAGYEAVAVAETILAEIGAHAWDSSHVGPMGVPRGAVISPPHFAMPEAERSTIRREAG